jgi:hypothetical protein
MAAIERSAYPRFASKVSTRELVQHFTLSGAEIEWAKSKVRGLRLQHAILVNLKCFQLLHYFPADEDIPNEVMAHVATVLGFNNSGKPLQELSPATRYRQHAAARQYLNISPFYGKKGRLVAVRAAQDAALIVQQRVDLVNAIIDELVRQRYELPAYSTLENIADVVASSGESKLINLVDSRLNDGERAGLDALLDGQVVSQRSPFDRIKQSPRRLSRSNMETLIDQLTWLEGLGDVGRPLAGLATQKVRYLASHAMTLDASDLKDLKPAKRYALMLAVIQRRRSRVRDDIAEMFVRRMAKIHKRAKEELKAIILGQRARTETLIAKLADVLTIVAEGLPDAELGRRIRQRCRHQQFPSTVFSIRTSLVHRRTCA